MSAYFAKTYQRAYGTFPLKAEALTKAIELALQTGYRAFDTAQMYQNESEVGAALAASGIARDELFITTKVENANFDTAAFLPSVEQSLKKLQVDKVDVLLLHWPPADGNIKPCLKLLQQAADEGLASHIGISNYTARMMREARTIIDRPIVCNQVEFHPLLNQDTLLAAAVETGIPLASYCSIARGEVLKYPLFDELAERYQKTPGQIVLRWILQKGVSINTMSTSAANISANFDVMDFTLNNIDMASIDTLGSTNFRIVNKTLVPWAPDFD